MSDPRSTSWILEVRARLSHPAGRRLPPSDARQAAVLVPLYVDAGELWTLLTRRTEDLPHHKGQIAFPGGKQDDGDDSVAAAALREAQEEVGLPADRVALIAELTARGVLSPATSMVLAA